MKNEILLPQLVISIFLYLSLLVYPFLAVGEQPRLHRVTGNLVVNVETATAIAKAVAIEIYGVEIITDELPLVAVRKGNVWHVRGHIPPNTPGGVVEVWISVKDGRILRLTHGM